MVPELRARGIGETLDLAVTLYRERFARLVRLAAIVVVPVEILSTFVLLSAQPDRVNVNALGMASAQSNTNSVWTQFAASVVTLLIAFIADAFVIGICSRTVADAYAGHTGAGPSPTTGRRLGAVLGASTLVALAAFVGLLGCGVGAFVVVAFLAVAMPVVVLEGVPAGRALARSWRLTTGNYFRVLGAVVGAWFLGWILDFGLAEAIRLLFRNSDTATTAFVISQGIASAIASSLTTPLIAAVAVVIYFDCRIREEAFDVQLLMQRDDAHYANAAPTA